MFEKQINFLPPEMQAEEQKEHRKNHPFSKNQVVYSTPNNDRQKELESKTLPPITQKTNLFQKIRKFFTKKKKQKNPPVLAPKKFKSRPEKLILKNLPKQPQKIKIASPLPKPPTPQLRPVQPHPIPPPPTRPKPLPPKPQTKDKPEKLISVKASISPKKSYSIPKRVESSRQKNTDVNLIPQEVTIRSELNAKLLVFFVGVFIAGLIIAISFFGVSFYSNIYKEYHATTGDQIEVLDEKINEIESFQFQSQRISERIGIVSELIKNHTSWLKLLKSLEAITHSQVTYNQFAGDDTGQVSLSATTDSLENFVQQVLYLKEVDIIEEFEFSSVVKNKISIVDSKTEGEGDAGEAQPESSDEPKEIEEVKFNLMIQFTPRSLLVGDYAE